MVNKMKKNETVEIYHDGKSCRGTPATVLAIGSGRVKVSFTPMGEDEDEVITWCRRRRGHGKKTVYEAIGWNYWIYPNRS